MIWLNYFSNWPAICFVHGDICKAHISFSESCHNLTKVQLSWARGEGGPHQHSFRPGSQVMQQCKASEKRNRGIKKKGKRNLPGWQSSERPKKKLMEKQTIIWQKKKANSFLLRPSICCCWPCPLWPSKSSQFIVRHESLKNIYVTNKCSVNIHLTWIYCVTTSLLTQFKTTFDPYNRYPLFCVTRPYLYDTKVKNSWKIMT